MSRIKKGKIGVVVPAFNEEKLIGRVLETMPDFVDKIIVVDDVSRDKTVEIVENYRKGNPKVVLIRHGENQGVGGAIVTGYKQALKEEIDVAVVMAGDGQMDPADLKNIVDPILKGQADYVKGNRLFSGQAWRIIPKYRYLGNSVLSLLTKIASGYWHIADSQTGYTSISKKFLSRLDLDSIYKRYGMPNDFLVKLNLINAIVKDVPVTPVYNIGEKSGIRLRRVIPSISWILIKGFFRRLLEKYVIKDFHPLVFFYLLGLLLTPIGTVFGSYLLVHRFFIGPVVPTSALFASFLFITGLQSLFFAMWFDMEYNKHLK